MTENTGTVDETVNSNSFNRSVIQEFRENSGKVGGSATFRCCCSPRRAGAAA